MNGLYTSVTAASSVNATSVIRRHRPGAGLDALVLMPSGRFEGNVGEVATEMALAVLAYNLTRVMNIVGTRSLMAALAR